MSILKSWVLENVEHFGNVYFMLYIIMTAHLSFAVFVFFVHTLLELRTVVTRFVGNAFVL